MPRISRPLLAAIASLLLIVPQVRAEPGQDPLRFISAKADLIIKVERPRQLVEAIKKLDAVKNARQLEIVQQYVDSAQVNRLLEFLDYFEHHLGNKWPDLIDKLAGGGIAAGAEIAGDNDAAVLLAVQGTDETLVKKFVEQIVAFIEQEAALPASKTQLSREKYKDFEVIRVGNDIQACRIESALLVSNKIEALYKGIDQHRANIVRDGTVPKGILDTPGLQQAKKLLPADPHLWLYYNLAYAKKQPQAKDLLTTPRNNTILTFLFAGYLDLGRRADFIAAGLYEAPDGFSLTIRMPAGREGMAEDVELHLPRDAKTSGSLPLLEPKGVIFSHSFYLDLATLWQKRLKIMSAANAKSFEEGVKQGGRFLPGTSLEKLFTQSGPYHRLVAVHQEKRGYSTQPQLKLPAFGYVVSMRDPAFAKAVETLIRGGAVLAGFQVKLKLFEEKHDGVALFGYRFSEEDAFPADEQNLRFNFVPTFATVKDQFIAASSVELCKELIDIIRNESAGPISQNMQMRLHARGAVEALYSSSDSLLTRTILDQAVSEAEAKKQIEQLFSFAQKLGSLKIETDYGPKSFRFDFKWKLDR